MNTYLGELAALGTSLCFSFTSLLFTMAGRQVGSVVVNRVRLLLAVLMLTITHWLVFGSLLPVHAGFSRWAWLGTSGFVGLVLGDMFLFQAFVWIGPRLSMLMMSLAPVIAALLAWLAYREALSPLQILGILLTLAGVAWVVLERDGRKTANPADRNYLRGVLFGLGAASGQALGLVLAKPGLAGDFTALSGNVIRMTTAAVILWAFTWFRRQVRPTLFQINTHRKSLLFLLGGAFAGPFLGVSLSLFSIQRSEVGIASTLMALPPVFLLPLSYLVFKERFGWRAVFGTLLSMVGVAVLFLV